jgi:hypothetical protein
LNVVGWPVYEFPDWYCAAEEPIADGKIVEFRGSFDSQPLRAS